MSIAIIRNLAKGGAPSAKFPWNALDETWSPKKPNENFSFPGGTYTASAICNVKSPKINNNILVATLYGTSSGWVGTGYVDVSPDGVTWTQMISSNDMVSHSASLANYNGQQLYIRTRLYTVNPNASNRPIATEVKII